MATITENRARQRELYGAPLAEHIHRLTVTLGISQARLARTLGLSAAYLSQLASAQRVTISDPSVLMRLIILDERAAQATALAARSGEPFDATAMLAEVATIRWQWHRPGPPKRPVPAPGCAQDGPPGLNQ